MDIPLSIITRLSHQHETIRDLPKEFTEEQIRRQLIPGKWSIFENIAHLQSYQHVFIGRTGEIVKGKNPSFAPYVAEADPLFLDCCERSLKDVINDLMETRSQIIKLISLLPPEDLIKKGRHPKYGNLGLLHWIDFFLLHEAHHLFTIFKLAGEYRK